MKKEFALLISLAACCFGCGDKKDPAAKTDTPASVARYRLVEVEKKNISEQVKLPAQLAAYEEVSIFPKVNGYVQSVMVDIGSNVRKGQTLMTLVAPELQQAEAQARERYARAKADYAIDKENYDRLMEAARTPGAISPMDLTAAKGKTEADSALSNAEKANWQMQQTMIGYLTVTAPFDGVITERNVHPGALVSAESKDKPMLELKQIEHLRLQIDVPENIAVTLHDKDTVSFYLNVFPGRKFTGRISRNSMNVNPQFRSELIELDVYNKDHTLAPGMYVDVVLNAKGNPAGLAVPKSAVITSTERQYVLAVRDNKICKVDVTTGNESGNTVEVFGQLHAGDEVIANANDEIREGAIAAGSIMH